MQGQRSTVQSLSDSFECEHGSSSNNPGLDQTHYWNNVGIPVDPRSLPDFLLSPSDSNVVYDGTIGNGVGALTGWNVGVSTPSDLTGYHTGQVEPRAHRVDLECNDALTSRSGPGIRLEERRFDPSNVISFESVNINLNSNQAAGVTWVSENSNSSETLQNAGGSWFSQNANPGQIFQDSSVNTRFVGHSNQALEPHMCKPGSSGTEQIVHSTGAVDPSVLASATVINHMAEDGVDRHSGSVDGRRLSCKRKALEGVSGQSSMSATSSFLQHSSACHPLSGCHNPGGSLSISSAPAEQTTVDTHEELLNQRSSGSRRAVVAHDNNSVASSVAQNSRRNYRMRINPSHQQDASVSASMLVAGGNLNPQRSHLWSSNQSSMIPSFNHLVEARPTATAIASSSSTPPHLPYPQGGIHPHSFHVGGSSRPGSSSNSPAITRERQAIFGEEQGSRTFARSISEHPMFVPATELRNFATGNLTAAGNVASSSRVSSSGGRMQATSASASTAQQNPPPHHSRRLSEIIRRSLFPSSSESGSQGSSLPTVGLAGPTSLEMVLPPGASHHAGTRHSYLRSALWMNRHGDGALGVPLSLRSLASAPEGRSRLASEIRSVLDLVRRGENIRFEDVLILDQSMLYGIADLHDRHRDMRLDVDNMSYEELLALEERIGNVSTGLSEEIVVKCLKQRIHAAVAAEEGPQELEPCCICQEEYVEGEQVGMLDCGHDFHTVCIKQWLMLKNLCPICKTAALVT